MEPVMVPPERVRSERAEGGSDGAITILQVGNCLFGPDGQIDSACSSRDPNGQDGPYRRILDDVYGLRARHGLAPDIVVATGDLVANALLSEYTTASAFLTTLLECLGLPAERVVSVPGDHDLNGPLWQSYVHECLARDEEPVAPHWPKLAPYSKFVEWIHGAPLPGDKPWQLTEFPDLRVVVAGLNSTMAPAPEDRFGYLGESQVRWFAEQLRLYADNGWLRVGVIHHNPTLGGRSDDHARLHDADTLQHVLASRLNLLLHGDGAGPRIDGIGPAAVPAIGPGPVPADTPATQPGRYQIVRITAHDITVYARRYDAPRRRWVGDSDISSDGGTWHRAISLRLADVDATFPLRKTASSEDTSAREEQLDQVSEACRLRWPTARITKVALPGPAGQLRYLRVTVPGGTTIEQFPVGLCRAATAEGDLRSFLEGIDRLYRETDPTATSILVQDDPPVAEELCRAAEQRGVILVSLAEFCRGEDTRRRADSLSTAEEASQIYRELARIRPAIFRRGYIASLTKLASMLDAAGQTERVDAVRQEISTVQRGRLPVAPAVLADERRLPETADLRDFLGIADLTAETVIDRWAADNPGCTLPIGRAPTGPCLVDLGRNGPHAVITGAAGAGKSELARALVTVATATRRPDQVVFLLITAQSTEEYAALVELPHTVGILGGLDDHAARRVLTSLEAEIRWRERTLSRFGAHDVDRYRAARTGDPALPAIPRLLLIIDDVVTIDQMSPNVVPHLLTIASRGRALGIHMVLVAREVPDRLTEPFRRHIGVWIALQAPTSEHSVAAVGVTNVARIPATLPGRGYVRHGSTLPIPFQAGRAGPWFPTLATAIREATDRLGIPPPRPVVRPPLPGQLSLGQLPALLGVQPATTDENLVIYGIADVPTEQENRPVSFHLDRPGHLLVAGGPESGRSQALRTLACAAADQHSSASVHVYGIDCSDGALSMLDVLPHCGAVVVVPDVERVARLLNRLAAEVRRREEILADGDFSDITEQRLVTTGRRLPHILLLVDRYDRFGPTLGEAHGGRLGEQLTVLMRDGGRVGIHLVLAGDESLLHTPPPFGSFETLVFRPSNRDELPLVGVSTVVAAAWGPGRAVLADSGTEIQVATTDGETDRPGQATVLVDLARRVSARDVGTPLAHRPFRVDDVPGTADRFHVGDAHGRPVGRGDVLAWLHDRYATRTSAALLGPRRAGKTWVLTELHRRLTDSHARSVHRLVLPYRSVASSDALASLLDHSVADRPSPAMALIDKAQEKAGTRDPMVFLLDEVGRLAIYDPAAVSWLRDLGQCGAWLVYSGTEKDWHTAVRWALTSPGSSFGNDVNARELGPWDDDTALAFLSGTAANLNVDLPPETTGRETIKLVGTWPFYIQVVGDAIVRSVQNNHFEVLSDQAALRRLVDGRLIDEWRTEFQGRWKEIGVAGQAALLVDPGRTPSSMSPAQRNDLLDTGILRPDDGWIADPPFFAWIARNASVLSDRIQ